MFPKEALSMQKDSETRAGSGNKKATFMYSLRKHFWLYLFLLPAVVYILVFAYLPMGGLVMAFKRYTGAKSLWTSDWVGLNWFRSFFNSYYSKTVIKNTLVLSLYSLATFPIPLIFALMLNELRNAKFKRTLQTIMYAPHFISIVVLVSMMTIFFSPNYGIVNTVIKFFGGQPASWMTSAKAFPHLYVWSDVWQNLGWNCIIYVAALSGIDPSLHEAAIIDGASRFQRIIHINLASILPTVVIQLILSCGYILSSSTDKILLMLNDLNADTAQVITTYVYERGLISGDFSYATAVGLFTNVVNLIILLTVNKFAQKATGTSLF
jgi:putative aldouronate transport system permease protein